MLLEQFGADMSVYTRMVCDTVCITVPKAIVHCMVRQLCEMEQIRALSSYAVSQNPCS